MSLRSVQGQGSGSEPAAKQKFNLKSFFTGQDSGIDPKRRDFLKALSAGIVTGGVGTLTAEHSLNWLFSEDQVIAELKSEILPLVEIGNLDRAKEILNEAILEHSEKGDFERVGRISLLAKEIEGLNISDPQLPMPSEKQIQENRSKQVEAVASNMDETELERTIAKLTSMRFNPDTEIGKFDEFLQNLKEQTLKKPE